MNREPHRRPRGEDQEVSAPVVIVLLLTGIGMFAACENRATRAEREQATARLATVETALAEKPAPRASQAEVRALLDRLGVGREPNPLPGEMIAYLGDWQGPLFRRGLHLVFYFDADGALVKYEATEVEGS